MYVGMCHTHRKRLLKGESLQTPIRTGLPKGTDAERLAALSRRDENGCLVWTGRVHPTGYGGIYCQRRGKNVGAHRLSYEVHVGPIPRGWVVCHRCDNPLCIEPSHLFVGTHADNVADRVAKRRSARGERHGLTYITANDVRAIRKLRSKGLPYSTIAERVGASIHTVGNVVRGHSWGHVS